MDVIEEESRPCLVCEAPAPEGTIKLRSGKIAVQCTGCKLWLPRGGSQSEQGAKTTWHRRMHPQYKKEAYIQGSENYGYPKGFGR